jgi:parvulin-like peptidyl-prolyl isomerase
MAAGPDDVIARCGETAIVRGQVDAVMQRLGTAGLPPGKQRQRAEAAVLEQLLDERVLKTELAQAGIVVTDAEIDATLAQLQQQVATRGEDFSAFLAKSGRSLDAVREQVGLEIALDRYVRPRVTATAIAQAFAKHKRDYDGTRLRISHVLLRPDTGGDGEVAAELLERAAILRRDIVQGRISFAEAARLHSAGPSRRQEGDLGWIARDTPMLDSFSSETFQLSKGGVSRPFATPFGVHIVKVTDVQEGRIGIDAVRPRLEQLVVTEMIRELVRAGRRRMPVSFEPGTPHLDPLTLNQPATQRQVIASEPAAASE